MTPDEANARITGFFAGAMGLRFTILEPKRVVAELVVTRELCTIPNVMHGVAIMAFADTVGAYGTVLNLADGQGTTTLESKTNFFAAGREGETVTAEATPLHIGRRTHVWETAIRGADGRLLAKVTQTQYVLDAR